ncbi:MAG TPA: trypsin-like peptidase domain-containing protein [Asanoa sp.]|nr:trypsin-like peptidase domain-containing protein [Asanoa sp.]
MSAGNDRTTWPETSPGYAVAAQAEQRVLAPEGPIYRPADRAPQPPDYGPPPAQLAYAPPGQRAPYPGSPFGPGVAAGPPPAYRRTGEKRPRRQWGLGVTLGLVVLLAGVVGYQAVRIDRLDDQVVANQKVLAEAQSRDSGRLDGLDGRATELENKLGAAFNPEAISSAALPSVFRVAAGDVTGTAFAVGKPASGGKTNLITNFHVVEDVYDTGGRQVFLERDGKRYPATIVAVNKVGDVAHLRSSTKITGLVTAKGTVKSGQQIVVVGAPLGLSDSVTTGVVSAVRELPDSNGPMIQFDAPINPGNSGGPVINSAKQVVGIATAKAQNAEGIGLAVPIKVACVAFKIC